MAAAPGAAGARGRGALLLTAGGLARPEGRGPQGCAGGAGGGRVQAVSGPQRLPSDPSDSRRAHREPWATPVPALSTRRWANSDPFFDVGAGTEAVGQQCQSYRCEEGVLGGHQLQDCGFEC